MLFFCVGVMYSGEYDACDVTLSVYTHRASLKNMPDHNGVEKYAWPPCFTSVRYFLFVETPRKFKGLFVFQQVMILQKYGSKS